MKSFYFNKRMLVVFFLFSIGIVGSFQKKVYAAWDHLAHIEFRGEDLQKDLDKAAERIATSNSTPIDTAKDVQESKQWQQEWQAKQNAYADDKQARKDEEKNAGKEWQKEQRERSDSNASGYNEVMEHGSKVSDGGSSI